MSLLILLFIDARQTVRHETFAAAMPPLWTTLFRDTLARQSHQVREPALTVLLLGQGTLMFVAGPLLSVGVLPYAAVDGLQFVLVSIS